MPAGFSKNNKVVIVKIKAGLGNQLFQYALGYVLAKKNITPLKLDLSWYETSPHRQFELDKLNISGKIATKEEISHSEVNAAGIDRSWYRMRNFFTPYYKQAVVYEKDHRFDSRIFEVPKTVYLSGYWQSEKYFLDKEEVLKKEFSLKSDLITQVVKDMTGSILSYEGVALHVRRTDYSRLTTHPLLPMTYYKDAIRLLSQQISSPHFFVFSDNISWVKTHLRIEFPHTWVSNPKLFTNTQELYLMTHCRHHIVANSSFSWWGAWLGSHPAQTVIAPQSPFVGWDTRDYFPERWIKIPAFTKHIGNAS